MTQPPLKVEQNHKIGSARALKLILCHGGGAVGTLELGQRLQELLELLQQTQERFYVKKPEDFHFFSLFSYHSFIGEGGERDELNHGSVLAVLA